MYKIYNVYNLQNIQFLVYHINSEFLKKPIFKETPYIICTMYNI